MSYKAKEVVTFKHVTRWLGSDEYSRLVTGKIDNVYDHKLHLRIDYEGMDEPVNMYDTLKFCRNKILHMYILDELLEQRVVTMVRIGLLDTANETVTWLVDGLDDFIEKE